MLNYETIKYEIELSSCTVHNQHPEVTINETKDNISLACCCEDFQQICVSEIQELLATQVQKSVIDIWNEGFKGL